MADPKEDIIRAYNDYFRAFQTLDPKAAASYYHVPSTVISPQGVAVMTTAAQVEAFFAQMMTRLKARGYGRSEFAELRVTSLSDDVALLSIKGTRYKTDGTELERIGVTYTLRRTDAGWKLAVLVMHDADKIVGPSGTNR